MKLPGQWETNAAVNSSISDIIKYNLSDDYFKSYDARVKNLSLKDIQTVSQQVVKPDDVNWFMVGDKAKIAEKLTTLGFDAIIEIDADGNQINPQVQDKEKEIKN